MATGGVVRLAPAKINLALHVTGRRADGYHLLDSIAVFADVGDRVVVLAADALTLSVSGRFAGHAPGGESDLAWRAADAFFEHVGLQRSRPQPPPTRGRGAGIRVEKNI